MGRDGSEPESFGHRLAAGPSLRNVAARVH
jgi:hypothetical protein